MNDLFAGKVVILSGVSGCGKSTYAKKLSQEYQHAHKDNYAGCLIVSADNYFIDPISGDYIFNPKLLSDAHSDCFRKFIGYMQDSDYAEEDENLLIVDNTNTTNEEVAPYVLGAQWFEWDVEIITIKHNELDSKKLYLNQCFRRNIHKVPEDVIHAQSMRLDKRELLPWCKNSEIIVGL